MREEEVGAFQGQVHNNGSPAEEPWWSQAPTQSLCSTDSANADFNHPQG